MRAGIVGIVAALWLLPSVEGDVSGDARGEPVIVLAQYGADPQDIYPDRAELLCLQPRTGKVRWKFSCGGVVFLPRVTRREVLVAAVRDRKLYCVDIRTGAKRWEFDVGGRGTYLYMETGEEAAYVASWQDSKTYAVDLATGRKRWESELADGFLHYAGGRLFLCSQSANQTFCLDAGSGERLWELPGGGWNVFTVEDRCYVPAFGAGKIWCVDAKTGKTIWEVDDSAWHVEVSDGRLYAAGYERGALRCLDAATGKDIWDTQFEVGGSYVYMRIQEGLAFAGRYGGSTMAFFDAQTGKELMRLDVGHVGYGYWMYRQVHAVRDRLFVANPKDRSLTCYRRPDLQRIWSIAFAGVPVGIVPAEGVLIVGAGKELLGVRPRDGARLWKVDMGDRLHYLFPTLRRKISTF